MYSKKNRRKKGRKKKVRWANHSILFIYTVLIERAIHNSMCSNALRSIKFILGKFKQLLPFPGIKGLAGPIHYNVEN